MQQLGQINTNEYSEMSEQEEDSVQPLRNSNLMPVAQASKTYFVNKESPGKRNRKEEVTPIKNKLSQFEWDTPVKQNHSRQKTRDLMILEMLKTGSAPKDKQKNKLSFATGQNSIDSFLHQRSFERFSDHRIFVKPDKNRQAIRNILYKAQQPMPNKRNRSRHNVLQPQIIFQSTKSDNHNKFSVFGNTSKQGRRKKLNQSIQLSSKLEPKISRLGERGVITTMNQRNEVFKFDQESIALSNHQNKQNELLSNYKSYTPFDFIPCLCIPGRATKDAKVFVHFHANGEDIGQTLGMLKKINECMNLTVISVEYPGYGIYKENSKSNNQTKSDKILKDAETVIEFVITQMNVSIRNIILSGRSIGSGPAFHLAAKYEPLCLMAISPFKSVTNVAKQRFGRIAEMFIQERFDNTKSALKVKCPTILIHGMHDDFVQKQDSIDLITDCFKNSMSHLFLRGSMSHNQFQVFDDII